MNFRRAIALGSILLLVIGIAMLTSIPVAFWQEDPREAIAGFSVCAFICLGFSFACLVFSRDAASYKNHDLREGFASVLFAWLMAIVFGALPFLIIAKFQFADAIFETASGYSTTGSSIIEDNMSLRGGHMLIGGLEALPKSLLYWRSLLHWIGGIGFVMFVLMVLPILGSGKHLYNAEVPGLKTSNEQITPRIASTSRWLILIYVILTAITAAAYKIFGMNMFDAICHAFATVATGGFSTHSQSFAFFNSPRLEWAAVFFMLVSASNFMLMLKVILQHKVDHLKNEEFNFYILLAVICTLIMAISLYFNGGQEIASIAGQKISRAWGALLRTAAFQVVSLMSTTGFATSDYTLWNVPGVAGIMLFLIFCGGCAGSTGGGFKCVRIIVLIKQTIGELLRQIFPHLLPDVRINAKRLELAVVNQTMAFTVLYLVTASACTLLLPFLTTMDFETAISAALSSISNVGPGLGKIAPRFTYAWMGGPAKILLSLVMISGRLELYTIFVAFLPRFWNSDGKM